MWGRAFAIGAVVYEDGVEVKTFYARCPIEGKVDTWVEENVLPQMVDMVETHATNVVSFRLAIGQRSEKPTHCLMQWTEKFCKTVSLQMWYFVWVEFYILPGEDSPNGEKLYPERKSDWQRYKLYQRLFYQKLKDVARKLGLKATFIEKEDTVLLTL